MPTWFLGRKKAVASTLNKKSGLFYGWIIVILSLLATTTIYGGRLSFGVFFEPLQDEFGWTRVLTAGAFSTGALFHGLFSLPMGWASDKYGPKVTISIGALVGGLGLVLASRMNASWQLYVFYGLLLGAGTASCTVYVVTMVSRWFAKHRGLALGIATSGLNMGMVVMAPLARYLITLYQWRTSYLIMGIIIWTVSIPAALFLKRDPAKKGSLPYGMVAVEGQVRYSESRAEGLSLREALNTRTLWLMYFMTFFFLMSQTAVNAHIVRYAIDKGMSPATGALILSMIGIFSMAGRIGIGAASDRLGRKLTLALAAMVRSLIMLWLVGASQAWMFYLFAVVFGVFWGASPVLWTALLSEFFGTRHMGTLFGVGGIAIALGGVLGPILAGYIFDVTASYDIAFFILAVVSFLVAAFVPFLRPEIQQAKEGR